MNIGIEATTLGYPAGGGIRTFLYYTIRKLAMLDQTNQYFVYTTANTTGELLPIAERQTPRWHVRQASGLTAIKPILWIQTGLAAAAVQDRLDILWLTRHIPPLLMRRIPFVATVFDLFYNQVPQAFPWYTRVLNKVCTEHTVRHSVKIITTSHATARDVLDRFSIDPKRIEVAYGGVDHKQFYPRDSDTARAHVARLYNIHKPFILASDAYNARKNFATLLTAYSMLPRQIQEQYTIVATGNPVKHLGTFDMHGHIRTLGLEDTVHLVGHVDSMPLMYSAASLFVFPSLYEGFGLPIIEAMACGCPVITSNISSMPEVAGPAALMADPNRPEEFAQHVERVLSNRNLADDLRGQGLEHASRFTWRAFAEKVLEIFEATAKKGT